MIAGIVLAAGESRRMGRQKLLLPYAGVPVIRHIVNVLLESDVDAIGVVTGKDDAPVEECLVDVHVQFMHNEHYKNGMLSSVRKGVELAQELDTDMMLLLGDQPMIKVEVVNKLLSGWREKEKGIHVASYHSRGGHPVVIHRSFYDEILNEFENEGLRGLMKKHSEQVSKIEMSDERVLMDMDSPADYEAALKQLENEL
jgi:molybdenum cofactor cytidylyltransferase